MTAITTPVDGMTILTAGRCAPKSEQRPLYLVVNLYRLLQLIGAVRG
jgi:hypothetical protein